MSPGARLAPLILALALLAVPGGNPAAHGQRQVQDAIAFEQRIGAVVPADLRFRDRRGDAVGLGDVTGGRPTILALAWYSCTNLCPLTLRNLGGALGRVSFEPGTDYDIVTVSIDPRDTPDLARKIGAGIAEEYGEPTVAGLHVLTGDASAIDALAEAVGFRFAYDEERDRYAHPAGLVVLDPDGRAARYFLDIDFKPRDLELALVEAGRGELGSPIDQVVLRCYAFDPETGTYTLAIMEVLRAAGLGFVLLMGAGLAFHLWRERRGGGDSGRDAQ